MEYLKPASCALTRFSDVLRSFRDNGSVLGNYAFCVATIRFHTGTGCHKGRKKKQNDCSLSRLNCRRLMRSFI